MYGRTLSLPDDAMDQWFGVLAVARPPEATSPRDLKRALARAIVGRFHGDDAARAAEERFDRVHVRHEAPDDMPELEISADRRHLPELLAESLGESRSGAPSAKEPPSRLGAAVFENSTACAPGSVPSDPVCVQVRPSGIASDAGRPELTRLDRGARVPAPQLRSRRTLCDGLRSFGFAGQQFFTESLILAQDERWRRA